MGVAADIRVNEPKRAGPAIDAWNYALLRGQSIDMTCARSPIVGIVFARVSQGRVVGYTPRPDRRGQVVQLLETVRAKVSVVVGGDGFEPTASSV